jgi:TRAP-type C4-dicarboxylate transport system permease small subunit
MESAFAALDRFRRLLGAAALWMAVALFGISMLLLSADIVMRYAFNAPMAYVSEVVTIAFIYVYLLGAAALYARNEDLFLDLLYNRVGPRLRQVWLLLIYLGVAATMLVTLEVTIQLMVLQRHMPTPLLRIPLIVEHGALVACCVVILVSSLVDALGCLIWLRSGREPWPARAAAVHDG